MCWFSYQKKGSGRSATERLRSAIGSPRLMRGLLRLDLDNSPSVSRIRRVPRRCRKRSRAKANMELDLAASFFFLRKAPNSWRT